MTLRTGLIVEVPEAEDVVREHRMRFDATAVLGVPAHVTVLYPMAAPDLIDDAMLARMAELAADVAPFEYELARTDWFGTDVLWLAPEPAAKFRTLTELFAGAFPDYPPYGGEFGEPVPHLTIGDRGPRADMRAAEAAIRPQLPVRSVARAVTLMVQQPARNWIRAHSFSFAQ